MWYREKPMWYRYFRCGIGIFPLRAFSDTTSEIISNRADVLSREGSEMDFCGTRMCSPINFEGSFGSCVEEDVLR
jgi:hypothetical protein